MKGIYVDGHERDDVVAARKRFIETIQKEVLPYVPAQVLRSWCMLIMAQ